MGSRVQGQQGLADKSGVAGLLDDLKRLLEERETADVVFLLGREETSLILQDSGVFEMLGAAQELGLEELRLSCEDHVTATLDVSNACTFLAAALEMNERSAPHG
ncbi:hypothetical protein B566_EDAN017493 [Ephemera danica]|nr:hypothetical protein B566_EDAN017493 [Ephemera danica]